MNIKALITTLAIGASSVGVASTASADPGRHEQYGAQRGDQRGEQRGAPAVRDHRWQDSRTVQVQPERIRSEARWSGDRDRFDRDRFDRDRDGDRDRFERPSYQPVVRYRERAVIRPVVRSTFWAAPYQARYAAPLTFSPFVNGQLAIGLGNVAGSGIELATTGGSTYVQQLLVQYSDGRQQVLTVGQWLGASNPALDIQTDGSPVASVVIYGSGSGVSAITY